MTTLADAFVRIRPDMDRFPDELRTKAEFGVGDAGKKVGTKFGTGLMAGIGAVFAATAVVDFFRGAFNEANEAAKVTRLTGAALRSTAGAAKITATEISGLAGRLSDLSGVDDEVIQSSENVLLTFTRVRNEVGKGNDIFNQGTEAALDLSAALGTDLQGATILVGKALNDPISGLTALRKAGIQFTDAQRDQIRTMVETGNVMDAQKIILAELTTQFGGAAEAAATPADKATVAWGNFQEMIGERLLPTLNEILQFGLDNQDWLVPLATSIGEMAVVIGGVVLATKAWNAAQSVLGIGLDTTAAKAKRTTLILGGAAIAIQAIGSAISSELNPQIEAATGGLAEWDRRSKLSGEAARLFGEDAEGLGDALQQLAVSGFAETVNDIDNWAAHMLGMTGPVDEATEKTRVFDAVLADLVQRGQAQKAFELVEVGARKANISIEQAKSVLPGYTGALESAERATRNLGDATAGAASKGKTLLDVWNELHGTMLDADEAMLNAKRAVTDVAEAFKEGGKSIVGNSIAALENRIALEKAARAAHEAADMYRENGGSAAGAEKIMRDFQRAAENATGATGKNRDAVHKLADELFGLPKKPIVINVDVQIRTSQARRQLARISDQLTIGESDGGILSFASGGVEQHVAQIVKAGTMRVWGEPETGGEGYIPLAPSKRTRSMAVLTDIARRFGYDLIARATSGSPGTAVTAQTGVGVVNNYQVEVKTFTDRFSLTQVMDELALHGVH